MQPTIADTLRALALAIIGHLTLAADVRRVLSERLKSDAFRVETLCTDAERWRIVGSLVLVRDLCEVAYPRTAAEAERARVRLLELRLTTVSEPAGTLSFAAALLFLQDGARIARAGWNGRGMWLALIHPGNAMFTKYGEGLSMQPCIGMRTAQGTMQPGWLASQADMLACDWYVLDDSTTATTPSLERVALEDAADAAHEEQLEQLAEGRGWLAGDEPEPAEDAAVILGCRDCVAPGEVVTFSRAVQSPFAVSRFHFEAYDSNTHAAAGAALEELSASIGVATLDESRPALVARVGVLLRSSVRNVSDRHVDVLAMVRGWRR